MAEVRVPVPAGVDEQQARRAAVHAVAVVALLGDVKEALAKSAAHVGPGHLAQAALREERWRELEQTWGMLTPHDVAVLTGNKPEKARDLTSNLRRRKGLAGVKRRGTLMYPGFQFVTGSDGDLIVAPAWTLLRDLLRPAQWHDPDLLAWAAAPNAWLEGRSPAEEIQDHPNEVTADLRTAAHEALPSGLRAAGAA
jgi:hypothetical protein